ncbi:MAG TPA: EamA family transporter, partial [bacterium]|nr:EamA family transporter [bacterium]
MHYLIIAVGIIAASFAAIFIRLAADAPALIIAAYRLVIATLLMSPFALPRVHRQRQFYTASALKWNVLSGICLALHFATWIASLKYTS